MPLNLNQPQYYSRIYYNFFLNENKSICTPGIWFDMVGRSDRCWLVSRINQMPRASTLSFASCRDKGTLDVGCCRCCWWLLPLPLGPLHLCYIPILAADRLPDHPGRPHTLMSGRNLIDSDTAASALENHRIHAPPIQHTHCPLESLIFFTGVSYSAVCCARYIMNSIGSVFTCDLENLDRFVFFAWVTRLRTNGIKMSSECGVKWVFW